MVKLISVNRGKCLECGSQVGVYRYADESGENRTLRVGDPCCVQVVDEELYNELFRQDQERQR